LTIYRFRVNMITSVLFRGAFHLAPFRRLCWPLIQRAMRGAPAAAPPPRRSPPSPIFIHAMACVCCVCAGTGCVMAGGLSALAIASLPSSMTLSEVVWNLQQYPAANAIVKFGIVFPLTYHYLGGLRHLVRVASNAARARGRRGGARRGRAAGLRPPGPPRFLRSPRLLTAARTPLSARAGLGQRLAGLAHEQDGEQLGVRRRRAGCRRRRRRRLCRV